MAEKWDVWSTPKTVVLKENKEVKRWMVVGCGFDRCLSHGLDKRTSGVY